MDEGWMIVAAMAVLGAFGWFLMWLWEHDYYFPFFILLAIAIAILVATSDPGTEPLYPIDVRH